MIKIKFKRMKLQLIKREYFPTFNNVSTVELLFVAFDLIKGASKGILPDLKSFIRKYK